MNATKGYYSVIQFCPDLARAESANVGVLLFCPEIRFIQAMTSTANDRIRRFFREYPLDLERINSVKKGVEERIRACKDQFASLEDLKQFIDTRANDIVLTEPRPVKVWDPQAELNRLYSQLVGGRQQREQRHSEMERHLNEAFHRPEFEGKIEFGKHIALPVIGREIVVPFAYRNGQLNLVQPTMLPQMPSKATNMALQLAGEAQLIAKHPIGGQAAQLIVVYGFRATRDGAGDTPGRVRELFKDFNVWAVPAAEVDKFAAQVAKDAH